LNKRTAVVIFAVLVMAGSTRAGVKGGRPASKRASSEVQGTAARDQFKQDFIKANKEYQSSLQALAKSYADQLSTITERNASMKELFSKGLISRVEMDRSDAAAAEARARIDGLQKEMKSADSALTAALNPGATLGDGNPIGSSTDWTTGNKKIDGLIRLYGGRYRVDPYLIYLVMHQESGFSSSAVSPKGAQGLMQLMPATAARYGVTNRLDAAQSIMGGAHYLSDLLQLFNGNVGLALAGYNAGEGAVIKYGNRVPPYQETRYYVRNISARYKGKS